MPVPRRTAAVLLLLAFALTGGPAPVRAAPPGQVGDEPVGSWPLRPEPTVEQGFDPPSAPWGPGHRGVDLRGRPGQTVHSALAGTVTFAGQLAGRGVIVVDHGATRTTYEPVTASVALGAQVTGGEPVGSLQLPGSHCFPRACLHWGWIESETYLDPLRLVGAGPVRLLPLGRDTPTGPAPLPRSPFADWAPLALALTW